MVIQITKRKRIEIRPDKAWQTKELLQLLMPTKGKSNGKRKTLKLFPTVGKTYTNQTKEK